MLGHGPVALCELLRELINSPHHVPILGFFVIALVSKGIKGHFIQMSFQKMRREDFNI